MRTTSRTDRNRTAPAPAAARATLALTAALVLGLVCVADLAAQRERADGGREGRGRASIAGAVVDAASRAPLGGATVVLQPEVMGAFPGPASGSAFTAATRTATTDAVGAYRFEDVPPGVYRLYVTRYSYRPYAVVVELASTGESVVSIGLAAEPIALDPVRARGGGPYQPGLTFGDDGPVARMVATDLRRYRYLTTDVRELTQADVAEAVTLGEPDLFRALQRLPGVATRSDYTAELWTRGAPWSHTRVYFDGVPVFNPLHALGIISGISSSAVGAVWFHPGVRSAGMAEGAAGVIDLQSRRGSGAGELNLQGDLSLMSAGAAMDQRVLDGRVGWSLSARRTYLDWLSSLAARATDGQDADFPFGFAEVSGRLDAWLGERNSVEASWLWEGDHIVASDATGTPLRSDWGNAVGRLTYTTRFGDINARHTLALSEHTGRAAPFETEPGSVPESVSALSRTAVRFTGLTGSFWPGPTALAGPDWSFGYALERHAVDYDGPFLLPIPRAALGVASPQEASAADSARWRSRLPVAALWGERTWAGERTSLRAGLRVEAGPAVRNGGVLRPAPRLSVRFTPIPEVALSAGYGRVYQYTQALAPGTVHLASMVATDAWVVAGPGVPAIRSDILTAGTEAWIGPGRLASLNVFGRHATGVALPDPRPGPVFEREALVGGSNTAYGLEAGVRQISGRLTGSVSYALTRSTVQAVGLRFPSAADRTHVLDATAMVRVVPSLRLGAAATAATGVPFTRTVAGEEECAEEPGCDPESLPWADEPHGLRGPAHVSLDLLVDWTTRIRGFELGAYAQLRNALGRENGTIYTGGAAGCLAPGCADAGLENLFEPGLPRLPVIGVRVRR